MLACRALDGVEENVFYRGELIATRRRYDSRLLLAHLGRLDKLTANAPANAFAEDFDPSLARFAEGSDAPEIDPDAAPREKGSGQCNTRSTTTAEGPGETLDWCPFERRMVHWLDALRNKMASERPEGAREPDGFDGYDREDVEDAQMAAFEDGVERWWLVLPPAPDDRNGEWVYAEEVEEFGEREGGAP